MGRVLIAAAIVVAVLIVVAAVFLTRRWRDKQLLKVNPLALKKKGLDRAALLELDASQKQNAHLRQVLGTITENLEQALSDDVVTMWGSQTKQFVEHAYQAARQSTKEQ